MEKSFRELQIDESTDELKLIKDTYEHFLQSPLVKVLIKQQNGSVHHDHEDNYMDTSEDEDKYDEMSYFSDDEAKDREKVALENCRFHVEAQNVLDPDNFDNPIEAEMFQEAFLYDNEKYDNSDDDIIHYPPEAVDFIRQLDSSIGPHTISDEAFLQHVGYDRECINTDDDGHIYDIHQVLDEQMIEQQGEKSGLCDIVQEAAEYANEELYGYKERDDAVTYEQILENNFDPDFDPDNTEVKGNIHYDPEYQILEEEYANLEDQIEECEEEHDEVESRYNFLFVVLYSFIEALAECESDSVQYHLRAEVNVSSTLRAAIFEAGRIRTEYGDFADSLDMDEIVETFCPGATDMNEVVKKLFEMTNTVYAGIEALCELFPEKLPSYMDIVNLNDIRFEQSRNDLCLHPTAFEYLVREISQDFKTDLNFEPEAFSALQTAAEDYLTQFFNAGNLLAVKDKRDILLAEDVRFARRIAELFTPIH